MIEYAWCLEDPILESIWDDLPGKLCRGNGAGQRGAIKLYQHIDLVFDDEVFKEDDGHWYESDLWIIIDVRTGKDGVVKALKLASKDLKLVGWTDMTYRLELVPERD